MCHLPNPPKPSQAHLCSTLTRVYSHDPMNVPGMCSRKAELAELEEERRRIVEAGLAVLEEGYHERQWGLSEAEVWAGVPYSRDASGDNPRGYTTIARGIPARL